MLAAYSSGVGTRLHEISTIRQEFLQAHGHALAADRSCRLTFVSKPIPKPPFAGNLPTDQRQLAKYIRWLEQIEGIAPLRDAWGRALRFQLRGRQMLCSSPGPDGIASTRDDIQMAVTVSRPTK